MQPKNAISRRRAVKPGLKTSGQQDRPRRGRVQRVRKNPRGQKKEERPLEDDGMESITPKVFDRLVADAEKSSLLEDLYGDIEEARTMPKDAQTGVLKRALSRLYSYEAYKLQLEAIRLLYYDRRDTILVAATGFRKSMIPQVTGMLNKGAITIMIIPLTRIGKDQLSVIQKLGGNAFLLSAETATSKNMQRIRAGEFTHVLMGPKQAVSEKFKAVAMDPDFQRRCGVVVIDELHLVEDWGRNFRTDYARLQVFRNRIGVGVPWFGTSATLSPETLAAVEQSIAFVDVEILRASINRPDLFYVVRPLLARSRIPHESLYFVLDGASLTNNAVPLGYQRRLSSVRQLILRPRCRLRSVLGL